MAKWASRVGSIGLRVKMSHGSKRVIFKQVKRVAGQTDLTRFALPTQNHVLVISYYLLLDIEKYLIHFCI